MKKRKGKRKQGFLRKSAAGIIAGVLALTMAVGVMAPSTETYALEKVADLDTTTKYTESLGDNASTEYAGRIWTDKTVYDEDSVTIEGYGGTEHTVTNDEDFLVAFSALATSQSISGQTQAPVDVVFVIDLSGSMSNSDSNMTINGVTKSRIAFTVDAVNEAITTLMRNPYARVGVVGYNREAIELLPLDHYTQVNSSTPYFTLNRSTASSQNARLTVRAVGTSGTISLTGGNSISVVNGTNIQDGLYEGMRLLSTETDTTVTIDGKEVTRIPSVIHLSDGAPTWSMDPSVNRNTDRNWWEPEGYELGNGSDDYYGNGMLAMMVGAYMKQQIDTNYGLTTAAQKTTLYSIGMGIEDLEEAGQRDLAHVTLNPGLYLDITSEEYEDNMHADDILGKWNQYCGTSGNDTTPTIVCGPQNESYELTHPNTGDISGDALKNYVDDYYDADESSSVLDIFTNIVGDILLSAPEVPTEHDPQNPTTSGYITYTDPIGEYMEVKDFKAIIYGGQKYELHTVSEDGTTYTFTETTEGNEVYGSEELRHILITVESTAAGNGIVDQTLKIQVPASLIPIRVNTVTLNTDGSVKTHTNNGTYPIRVFYTVGLQDAVENEDGTINTEVLSEEYIENHLNTETGMVDFYSNLYTGTTTVNGMTVGDTTAEFVAASTNPFYYMQNDTYLLDEDGNKVTVLNDEENYHYYEEYYHGNEVVREQTIRTGAQLKINTALETDADGYIYRPAGSPRVNRMLEFEGTKSENNTKTAQDFYAPTYDSNSKRFKVYLGNNGVLSVEATGSLEISKTVTADEGLTAPDTAFTFTVSLTDRNGQALTGSYSYKVTDATGAEVEGSAGVISDGETLTLLAGQTATIINLPHGVSYTVTETAADGFATTVNGEEGSVGSGTIAAGTTQTEAFANHYAVEPITYPTEGGITGKKYFEGRPWETTDNFVFEVTSPDGSPLPTGEDVTVSEGRHFVVLNGYEGELTEGVEFSFGSIQFTRPDTYHYTIVELTPGVSNEFRLPGVSYTRETYALEIVVEDKGDGTLEVTSSTMKKVMAIDGTPVDETAELAEFTNKFSASSVQYGPVVDKVYTDHSGKNDLTDGMFSFTMTALESTDEQGNVIAAEAVPMPEGTNAETGIYTATNAGRRISFSQVTYDEGDVGHTYWYELKEVYPTEDVTTNADGSVTKDGMTYDTKTYHVKVVVDYTADPSDSTKSIITVTPTYYLYADGTHTELSTDSTYVATFTNSYEETPVIVGEENGVAPIQGTKTLTGRDMKDGEVFTFTLTPAADDQTGVIVNGTDISTATAVADGYIELSKTTATVSGSTDGVAAAFDFAQTTFKKQGTFTFNIRETIPEGAVDNGNGTYTLDGVTYDAHVCIVTVVVTDNLPVAADDNPAGDGKLEAEVSYSDSNDKAEFKNTYKAVFDKSTAIDLYGTKKLTGRPLYDGNFYFSVDLLTDEGTVPLVPNKAGTADAAGTYEGAITFLENQEYTAAGEYVYIIKEQIPAGAVNNVYAGVTYDTAQYKVVVTVSDKDELGSLVAEITSIEKSLDGGTSYEAAENIVFSNRYEAESAVYDAVDLEKVLSSDSGTALADGQFSFIRTVTYAKTLDNQDASDGIDLLKVDGTVVEDATGTGSDDSKKDIVTNNANGTVTFGDIRFTKKGVYVVEVREIIPAGAVPVDAEGNEVAADSDAIAGYELNDIIYDPQVVTRTFRVVDNEDGSLVVEVIGLSGSLTFTNREIVTEDAKLPGAEKLVVSKIFDRNNATEAKDWISADAFTFVLAADLTHEETAQKIGSITLPENLEVTINRDDATAYQDAFGDIAFAEAGTYRFTITEKVPEGAVEVDGKWVYNGITYDSTPRTVTVTVSSKIEGNTEKLTVDEASYSDTPALTFTNTFEAGELEGKTNLVVKKVFDRNDETEEYDWLPEDSFKFKLEAYGNTVNAVGKTVFLPDNASGITIGYNTENKTASFGDIIFYEAGEYEFVITEDTSNQIDNVGYDYTQHIIKVTVANENGKLAVSSDKEGTFTFTNRYPVTKEVELPGETYLKITKNFTGRDGDKWLETDAFEFTLKADTTHAATAAAIEAGHIGMPADKLIVNSTNKDTASFGNIVFRAAGTYQFIVTEIDGGIPGVVYDTEPRVVTVTVGETVIKDTTTLTIDDVAYSKALTFNNVYKTGPVTLEGATYLTVEKSFTGRVDNKWLETDAFTFTLKPNDQATEDAVTAKDIVFGSTSVTINSADADKKASFGNITFYKKGIYNFVIEETAGSIPGVAYDEHKVNVQIVVTDNDEGNLVIASPTIEGSMTWSNNYVPQSVSVGLNGKKQLDGRQILETDEFTFTIAKAEGSPENTPMPEYTTVKAAMSGAIEFGAMPFNKAGVYKYVITEQRKDIAGVSFDEGKVEVTVTITDNTNGTLSANVTYTKVGGNGGEGFVFINKYTTNPTDPLAIFKATKTVTASEGNSYTMKGGEFEFEIIPSETNPTSDPVSRKTVTNDVNGAVVFVDAAQYTEPGVYVYAIHEKTGSQEGMSYDGSIYTLTVTVTDDQASAKLKVAYTLTKDGSPAEAITFNNGYDPKEVSVTISGLKKLTGKELEAGMFKFKLTPVDGAPMPASGNAMAANTASGMFHFDPIIYDRTGTFKYVVTEVDLGATGEGKAGYNYDHTEYQVTVEVTDTQVVVITDEEAADSVSAAEPEAQNEESAEGDASAVDSEAQSEGNEAVPTGSGILKATVTIDKGEIVFNNTYVPKPVTLAGETALRGTKTLTGRKLNDGEFTFLLKDSANKTILEAVNKNGKFTFEPLTYTKEGVYYYTITEKQGDLDGVTYDDSGYQVAVTVTDAGGYLKAVVEYTDSQGKKADVVFNNKYSAAPATAEIGAAKVLNGRDLKAKEFKFVLKDAEGKVVAEAMNAADGKVSFGEIEYTKAGVYKYTVSEEKGDLKYVTYDDTVYTVTVTVTDDSKGNLAAKVDTGTKQIVFENTYKEPEKPKPEEPKDPDSTPDSDPDTTPTSSPTPTPTPATPDTGDNTNIVGFVALAVVALVGGIGFAVYRRKKH